ncbi:MAG: dihydroorotase family protein [Nitrososphaerota archaeon]|jgi:dihydroorotase (multifunctional complex type)|nr:dihydroorotase family protein [Nitrososphaerota archaeon]MDG6927482.1 dihydroorotase family protein [Nitrososphaerota archaeon]MDG6930868.1 dihydroorotase family protein [Nitrososphaerota archaeon]MDG6931543.1 dihydroorotase family protein [Nitrososphaerota archaeon]MDG6936023.1 dihydroorotase family protein [Nitrososphaerota archaeon]
MESVVIRDGLTYTNGILTEASVLVENGKIAKISKGSIEGDRVIDASGKLVLPGAIDVHAHTHDPGFLYREDFEDASRAALLGGITAYVEMPLVKDIDDGPSFEERKADGARLSYVDFGIHAGFMRAKNYARIGELNKLGLRTFKVFTCRPFQAEDGILIKLLAESESTGSLMLFHSEDEGILSYYSELFAERRDQLCVHEARPAEAEELAISKIGSYSLLTGGHAHIVHLSSALGLEAISRFKGLGADITSETCPHYLIFTRKDAERLGPYAKMAPSLKGQHDVEELWKGLQSGKIEMVTTDHAPGTHEEKDVGYKNPWQAWGGIPGLATMFPLIYTEGFERGRLDVETLVKVTSENAAKRFGMLGKGSISVGNSGDLMIIDRTYERVVDGKELYKVGWSAYDGMKLKGWPQHVLSGGELAVEDWNFVKKGRGKFIELNPPTGKPRVQPQGL